MKNSWIILLFALLLTACSDKYAEGPQLSVLSAKQRVTGQWEWAIARTIRQGQEVNNSLLFTNDTLHFHTDGTVIDSRYSLTGEWDLISKNTEINLLFGNQADTIGIPGAIAFQIKRLLKQEMWLEFADDSTTIEWQLNRLAD
jgi:hypothetical protein